MIHATDGGVCIDVRVIPRSGRAGVAGARDRALLVRLNAPPVEGAANSELIEVIAEWLDVPKRAVTLISGGRSRQKRIRVAGVGADDVRRRLTEPRT